MYSTRDGVDKLQRLPDAALQRGFRVTPPPSVRRTEDLSSCFALGVAEAYCQRFAGPCRTSRLIIVGIIPYRGAVAL